MIASRSSDLDKGGKIHMLYRWWLRLGAMAMVLVLTAPARAAVVATPGGFEVSYALNLSSTLNGNPVTSIFMLETDGVLFSAASGFSAAASGFTLLTHTIAFQPTSTLVIGLDLPTAGVGDGKTHLVMLMNGNFAASITGKLFSQAFPGVNGQPRLGHDALIAAMQAADAGDAVALGIVTNFFLTGAGAFAAFDPAGSFQVGEFTVFVPIAAPEPASLALLLAGVAGLGLARRRQGAGR